MGDDGAEAKLQGKHKLQAAQNGEPPAPRPSQPERPVRGPSPWPLLLGSREAHRPFKAPLALSDYVSWLSPAAAPNPRSTLDVELDQTKRPLFHSGRNPDVQVMLLESSEENPQLTWMWTYSLGSRQQTAEVCMVLEAQTRPGCRGGGTHPSHALQTE